MKPFRLITLCLCVFVVNPAAAQKINLPAVTRVSFDNGVRVILMEYPKAPTISLTAIFPGGGCGDPADKAGVGTMTAALLRKGTDTKSATQIAEEVDFLGASLGAGSDDDKLSVSLYALSKDTVAAMDLFTDAIRKPSFPNEEMERARQLELAGLKAMLDDPGSVVNRVSDEVVFAGHPYGSDSTMSSVKAITRDDVLAYYRRFVVPNHMILVAVGDFRTTEMLERLRARFGDWKKSDASGLAIPPVKPALRRVVLVDKPDATQTQVHWVGTAFARASPDYFPSYLAGTMLGGAFTSRLVEEIRVNRGLTYDISSRFTSEKEGGSFTVATFTKIETTKAILDAVRAVLKRTAAGGFTTTELTKFKQYLLGSFAIHMQSPEAIGGELGEMAFYGLPNDYLQTYLAKIRAVTLAQVNRIARRYFNPDSLSVVLVAPAKHVANQVKSLGTIENRGIDSVAR